MPGCKRNHVLLKLKDNEDKYVNTSATKKYSEMYNFILHRGR